MKTPNTSRKNVAGFVLSSSGPSISSNATAPTSGKNAYVDRFASQDCHGGRRATELSAMASTPKHAAGAGPSSVIASTSDRNAAETLNRFVSSSNAPLAAAT